MRLLNLGLLLISFSSAFVHRPSAGAYPPRSKFFALTLQESESSGPVILRDVDRGRAIECYTHSHAKPMGDKDGAQYIVCTPCDPCIEICEAGADDEVYPLQEDDGRMDSLFPIAAALLEEDDMFLVRSAATLTLQGDLEMDSEDESVEVEELASFEYECAEYVILRIVAPLLLVAKARSSSCNAAVSETEYQLLQGEELVKISVFVQTEVRVIQRVKARLAFLPALFHHRCSFVVLSSPLVCTSPSSSSSSSSLLSSS